MRESESNDCCGCDSANCHSGNDDSTAEAEPPRCRRRIDRAPPACDFESRIVREDRLLQLLQRRARLKSNSGEVRACVAICLHRVCLSSRLVQREHQLTTKPLAQWMLRYSCLNARHQRAAVPERQLGVKVVLDCSEPFLFKSCHLDLRERLELDVGEGTSSPQAERLVEQRRCSFGSSFASERRPSSTSRSKRSRSSSSNRP